MDWEIFHHYLMHSLFNKLEFDCNQARFSFYQIHHDHHRLITSLFISSVQKRQITIFDLSQFFISLICISKTCFTSNHFRISWAEWFRNSVWSCVYFKSIFIHLNDFRFSYSKDQLYNIVILINFIIQHLVQAPLGI